MDQPRQLLLLNLRQFLMSYHYGVIVCSLKAKDYPGGIIFPRPGHINFLLIPHPANKVPQAAVFSDIIKA